VVDEQPAKVKKGPSRAVPRGACCCLLAVFLAVLLAASKVVIDPPVLRGNPILAVLGCLGSLAPDKDQEKREAHERLRQERLARGEKDVPFSQMPITESAPAQPQRTVEQGLALDRRAEIDARVATSPEPLRLEAEWFCGGRLRASVLVDDGRGLWVVALLEDLDRPAVCVALGEGRAVHASKEGVTCVVNGEERTFDVRADLEAAIDAAYRAAQDGQVPPPPQVLIYRGGSAQVVAQSGVPLPEVLATLRDVDPEQQDLAQQIARITGQ
jgi:hypothetical protein